MKRSLLILTATLLVSISLLSCKYFCSGAALGTNLLVDNYLANAWSSETKVCSKAKLKSLLMKKMTIGLCKTPGPENKSAAAVIACNVIIDVFSKWEGKRIEKETDCDGEKVTKWIATAQVACPIAGSFF